jgi:hypothetical protein
VGVGEPKTAALTPGTTQYQANLMMNKSAWDGGRANHLIQTLEVHHVHNPNLPQAPEPKLCKSSFLPCFCNIHITIVLQSTPKSFRSGDQHLACISYLSHMCQMPCPVLSSMILFKWAKEYKYVKKSIQPHEVAIWPSTVPKVRLLLVHNRIWCFFLGDNQKLFTSRLIGERKKHN